MSSQKIQNKRIVRLVIPEVLYRRYKILCAQTDLSMTKQTQALIRKFVEVHEKNIPAFLYPSDEN
jgi:hypothetical protein